MEVIRVDCKLDDTALAQQIAEKLNAFLKTQNEQGALGIKKGPYEASIFPPAMLAALRKEGLIDMDVSTRSRFQMGPRFQCPADIS